MCALPEAAPRALLTLRSANGSYPIMETKKCTLCLEVKSVEEFHWANRETGRWQSRCKMCQRRGADEYKARKVVERAAIRELENERLRTADKKCSRCREVKPASEFGGDRWRPTGLNPYCRPCQSRVSLEKRRRSYARANEERNARRAALRQQGVSWDDIVGQMSRDYRKLRRGRNRDVVWLTKSDRGCMDCGIKDPRVLHFDHIADNKESSISQMIARGALLANLLDEMDKCEVVCSNCHMIRTGARAGWWGYAQPVDAL